MCDEGYSTDATVAAAIVGVATSRVIASVADQCTAIQCPFGSLRSGSAGACTCVPGFFGSPVWDTTLNAYSTGCTACTPAPNALAVTCAAAGNSRATCDMGFHRTVNTAVSDTCTRRAFDGEHCEFEINVCDFDEDDCDPINGQCHHLGPGHHDCTCHVGWQGDGHTCFDIDECASQPCANGGVCWESACSVSSFPDGAACTAGIGPGARPPIDAYRCDCAAGWGCDNCDGRASGGGSGR